MTLLRSIAVFCSLVLAASACGVSSLETYCDPEYEIVFDYPKGWVAKRTSNRPGAAAVWVSPDKDSKAGAISVGLSWTTEDAAKFPTAASRLNVVLGFAGARVNGEPLEMDHSQYDGSAVLIDRDTGQAVMVYIVIPGEPERQVFVSYSAEGAVTEADLARLHTLVESLRHDPEMTCPIKRS